MNALSQASAWEDPARAPRTRRFRWTSLVVYAVLLALCAAGAAVVSDGLLRLASRMWGLPYRGDVGIAITTAVVLIEVALLVRLRRRGPPR